MTVGKVGVSISARQPAARLRADRSGETTRAASYRSDDGGTTWTRTFTGRDLQQRAWYYTHIVADPVDVDTVYALNVGAFKSTDGGKTFTGNAGISRTATTTTIWINPRNNKAIVVGNDGGGTVSAQRRGRGPRQNNQPTSEIYRLTVDTRWPYWVYGAQQDNSTVAVPSQGNEATVRRRRRRERPHRRRSARLQHRLRRQLRRLDLAHRSQVRHAARTCASTPTCRPGSAPRT